MKKALTVFCCLILILVIMGTEQSYADDAAVLPKGVVGIVVDGRYYIPFKNHFNNDGHTESIAVDFNANLNSNVFPSLGQIEQFFGLPPGFASVGRSVVSFKYEGEDATTLIQYGLTDRLTVGIRIPYYWRKNKVDSYLDISNATVGKNAALNTLTPLLVPGTVPLTKHDVLSLLGPGLDIGATHIPGFGFDPFRTWSNSGVGDIEVGGRYQYLKTKDWRLAFTGGVRFPTGEVDDLDNLVDNGLGDGAYALLFQFSNDYTGIKNLVLNATARYALVLPDTLKLRVPENIHQPITTNEQNVHRNQGDVIELETSATYEFFNGFTLSLLYKFGYRMRDHVEDFKVLEDETRAKEHVGVVSLCYSTLPLFLAKKFPIPLSASISYRNRFAGQNVLKSQYLSLALAVYF